MSARDEPWRGLRMYSSSALGELTTNDLEDWAGTSRQAIAAYADLQRENERLREALSAIDLARYTDVPADWERATKLTDAALNPAPEQQGEG